MSYQPVFSTPSSPSNKASYAPSPVKSSLRAYNIDLSIRIDEQESPRIQKISCRLDESDAYRPARQPPDKQPPVIFKPKFSNQLDPAKQKHFTIRSHTTSFRFDECVFVLGFLFLGSLIRKSILISTHFLEIL